MTQSNEHLSPSNFTALFNEINSQILSGVDYKDIFNSIFDSPQLRIPFDRIGVAMVTGQGAESRMTLEWTRSKIPVKYLQAPYSALIKGSSLQPIIETGEARIISNLENYLKSNPNSESTRLILKDGIKSSLTCPIRSDGKSIGVIFFSSCQASTYNSEHIKYFSDLSDEMSLVLNHARLQNTSDLAELNKNNLRMTLHDLMSPLNTLFSFAELALTENWFENLHPEAQSIFRIFSKNTKYMSNLLNELNDIASLKNGSLRLNSTDVRLDEFIEEIVLLGHTMANKKEITFLLQCEQKLPVTVRFDQHKIIRVLENFLSNAIKFSYRKTIIRLIVSATASKILFSIADHGQGIPANELAKLFKDFGKTSVQPTENEGSTGQGLAISKQIIKLHGGDVLVESTEAIGSTFSFWLPLVNTYAAPVKIQ